MGQAQVLQAEALQEMGIKSRLQTLVTADQNQNLSFIPLSICPGNNQSTYYAQGTVLGAIGSVWERARLSHWGPGMLARGETANPKEGIGICSAEKRSEHIYKREQHPQESRCV